MNIGIILASGESNRFKSKTPKQYFKINNKYIVQYSIETFLSVEEIDFILVVVNKKHVNFLNILKKNYLKQDRVIFCFGGETRLDSFILAMDYLKINITKNINRIITHDGARPLVSKNLILKHINLLNKHVFINTIFKISDTVVEVLNDLYVSFPNREKLYLIQTPQSFNYEIFSKLNFNFNNEKIDDLSKIFYLNKIEIKNVNGDFKNIKITYRKDLDIITTILNSIVY